MDVSDAKRFNELELGEQVHCAQDAHSYPPSDPRLLPSNWTRGGVDRDRRGVSSGFDRQGKIFPQGPIMGMSKDLIGRRFDEIVEFSGIAQFIDIPVKCNSNGMNARLGFSIAAHLDSDVLVVYEVLSVGDVRL